MTVPVTTNLRAQFDATAFVGFSNNDPIASWTDQTANGYVLSQATASRRPQYQTNIFRGSMPAVYFNVGNRNSMQGTIGLDGAAYGQYTTFTVFRAASTVGGGDLNTYGFTIHGNTGVGNYGMWLALRAGEVRQWAHTANSKGEIESVGAGILNNTDYVLANFSTRNTVSGGQVELDGANILTQNSSTAYPTGVFCIGDLRDNRGIGFSGWIGELLVYDRVLDSSEKSAVDSYLREKWVTGPVGNQHYIMSGGSFVPLNSVRIMVNGTFQEV